MREAARSDRLVQRDRQDELPVHRADAEAGCAKRVGDVAVGEHAVRLGAHADGVHDAPRRPTEQRDAARRRVVDDHQAIGDAAQLGDAASPLAACASARAG